MLKKGSIFKRWNIFGYSTSYIFIFPLFLCLFFASCKQKRSRYVIGISQCSDDEWRHKMNSEMVREVALYQDVTLEIKTVVDDTEKQIEHIQSFIDQKVDMIIVSPNKATPMTPVVEKAYHAGIPVILVDRKILSDQYTAFIGADNYQIGKEVGTYIVSLLKEKGKVAEIRGLEGSTPALERHLGFYSVISKYPGIQLIHDSDGAWLKDMAENKMEEILSSHPDVDLVYAQNDRMAMGAYNAAKRHHKTDSIYFLGIDALPGTDGGIELVQENKLKATFIYPTGGDRIIQLAMNILEKKPYEKNNLLNTAVVDNINVKVIKLQIDEITAQENKISFLNKRVDTYLSQYTTQKYLLFSAIFFVFLFIVFSFFLFRAYRMKHSLYKELEKRNDEINEQKNLLEQQRDQLIILSRQLEEATHAKLVFFTNISHEFRTPLTLISGPVSSLLSDKTLNQEQVRLLSLAQKNIGILLKLIDQIIDFRKYENGKLNLNLDQHDFKKQLIEWNESFSEIAKKRNLNFDFNVFNDADFLMFVDIEKMERIYFNLLSNAFKFTHEKGVISVALDKMTQDSTDYAIFQVSNSGKGISEKDIKHIFDRFYQVNSHLAGSGIGLALVKAMVELHNGKIQVSSDREGWTTFTVMIPFLKKESDTEINTWTNESLMDMKGLENDLLVPKQEIFDASCNENKDMILVVDDNPDIRSYIKTVFQGKYMTIEAGDGDEGFKKAVKYVPDLIISDVMMPNIDGFELCLKLKDEISTNHIPVILLTAKSQDDERIIGFNSGADDYISKPFSSDVLEVRVRNLIETRRLLKEVFQKNLFSGTSENKETFRDVDKTFLEKFRTLIEENLSNSTLNVEDLGQSIGLSRTQLYRKVKSLTNYSPNELLRIMRLKKAHNLLSVSELTISEVTYDVGFTSPSYFTKCFKEYYNESPTDYLKRVRQK